MGGLILRNVSVSSAGLECVCVSAERARVQNRLVYQPWPVIYKTFVPSLGERRRGGMRERERRGRV